MRLKVCLLLLLCATAVPHAYAGKKGKKYMTMIEASSKQVEGPNATKKNIVSFLAVWHGTQYPETFFWRGENGWATCKVQKAARPKPWSAAPATTSIDNKYIHKGDTLFITPMPGGKFPVPEEIPVDAKNTLYFKTGGSGWLAFPVKMK